MLPPPLLLLLPPLLQQAAALVYPVDARGAPLPGAITTYAMDPQFLWENRLYWRSGLRGLNPAINRILRFADAAARDPGAYAVTSKARARTAPSGDPKDFFSLARYFWPPAASPDGIYARFDGYTNPEIYLYQDPQLLRVVLSDVYNCALAFFFSGNETFAATAASRIQTWFLDPQTAMNPSLEYSNWVKGSAVSSNSDGSPIATPGGVAATTLTTGGLLDFSNVYQFVDAVNLLRQSKSFTDAQYQGVVNWLTRFYNWMQTSNRARIFSTALNNQGTWSDVQAISILLFLNRTTEAAAYIQTNTTNRMNVQTAPRLCNEPLELERTRSWFYSLFNLQGLFVIASLADSANVPFFNVTAPNGCSLQAVLDYHIPFAVTNGTDWPSENIDTFDPSILIELCKNTFVRTRDVKYQSCFNTLQAKPKTWNPSRLWTPYSAYDVPIKSDAGSISRVSFVMVVVVFMSFIMV